MSRMALFFLSLLCGLAAGSDRFSRVVESTAAVGPDGRAYEPPRAAELFSGVKAGRRAVPSQGSTGQSSEPLCFTSPATGDEQICKQDHYNPSCPAQFVNQAHWNCWRLVRWLKELEGMDVNGTLTWWTSNECLVHKTRCEVLHTKHGAQYEEDVYNFHEACENTVTVSYHYSYQLDDGQKQQTTASVKLHDGSFGTVYQAFDDINGSKHLIRQEDVQILMYEKNSRGHFVVGDTRVDTRVDSSIGTGMVSPEGLWAQFVFKVQIMSTRTNKLVNQKYQPRAFHVSPTFSLSNDCPDESLLGSQAARRDYSSDGGISAAAAIAIALAAFTALFFGIWAIRQTIMRARAENTRAAAEANEKRLQRELELAKRDEAQRRAAGPMPVEQMQVVTADNFTGGSQQVVQGVVITRGVEPAPQDPCQEAPVPPPQPQT
eukprot:Hpha_TRINITY_DN12660_c1_g1::TRINITY_DN12660_c1_g1_i1::g.49714::m.49714